MDYKEIKSYADACKALGIQPLADEAFAALPKAERENIKAYHQLTVITRAINDGWEPDFTNREQRKYEPYAYTNTAGLAYASTHYAPSYTAAVIGSRLCFPDYDRAAFAVKTFNDLYLAYFLPGKWEEDETQEPTPGAAGKGAEQAGADGGTAYVHEDDMSDAPDFLQKVMASVKERIEPLCDKSTDKGVIVIAVEDGVKDEKDGGTYLTTSVAVHGEPTTLAKGLNRFLAHKESEPIVKRAFLYNKLDRLMRDGASVIKDILKNF